MLLLPRSVRIYLTSEPVDLRGGHDRLAAVVRAQWGAALFDGHLFVFLGRRMDRCKVLFWDRGGLVLYYKRLERGRFQLPRVDAGATSIELDGTSLAMLLDGIDVRHVHRPQGWEPRRDPPHAA